MHGFCASDYGILQYVQVAFYVAPDGCDGSNPIRGYNRGGVLGYNVVDATVVFVLSCSEHSVCYAWKQRVHGTGGHYADSNGRGFYPPNACRWRVELD